MFEVEEKRHLMRDSGKDQEVRKIQKNKTGQSFKREAVIRSEM